MPSAVKQEKEQPRSIIFTLIDEATVSEGGKFRVAVPGGVEVKYLTFRQYASVTEAEELRVRATVMASAFKPGAALPAELEEFRDQVAKLDKGTVYTAFLLGVLCEELSFPDFVRLAIEAPMLFLTLRDGVDAACVGIDAYLFKEGLDAAKKG